MTTQATTDAVRAIWDDPAIVAVCANLDATDAAILAGDVDGFMRSMAPECVVNSPAKRVIGNDLAAAGFRAGLIDYHSIVRDIEYAAIRPNGEVVLMGCETVTPRGRAHAAGKTVVRRVTEVWRPEGDDWLCAIRHATLTDVR